MRIALLFIFLLALRCSAVQWVISGAAIETNGWVLRLTNYTAPNLDATTAANTNLQFNNGFTTNNSPSITNMLTLTLTSMGYDDTGAGITMTRTIYGTKVLRAVYPMQNTNDIQPSSVTNCVIRIALSDFVFTKDSNVTMAVLSGALSSTNGAAVTNCMATNSFTVINASSVGYPPVIGNWTWPPYQRIMTNTFYPHAVAFHWSSRNGRPVRVVQFIATDTNSIKSTNFQTKMVIDLANGDVVPFGEYVGALDVSAMSNGSPVRIDMVAYPWIGDAPLDTTLNTFTGVTPRCSGQTNLLDRLQRFNLFAVVDTNSSGAGVVSTGVLNTASPPNGFRTVGQAAAALKETNRLVYGTGFSNVQCGLIYVMEGNHGWLGTNTTYGNPHRSWLTVLSYPTNTAPPEFTNMVSNFVCGNLVCFSNVNITTTDAGGWISGHDAVWLDNCRLMNPSGVFCYQNKLLYITRTTLRNTLGSGLKPFGGVNMSTALVRGSIIQTNGQMDVETFIGNAKLNTNYQSSGLFLANDTTASAAPFLDGTICYNNKITFNNTGNAGVGWCSKSNFLTGCAFIQNVLEWVGTSAQTAVGIASDNSVSTVSNVLFWNNTIVGQRRNMAYNETGTTPLYRVLFNTKNDCIDDDNIKTDTFTTANAARTGNWSACFGVSCSGNYNGEITNVGVVGFTHYETTYAQSVMGLPGLFSYETLNSQVGATNEQKFVNRLAYNGAVAAGLGDYRLQSISPLMGFHCEWLLPFDIEGQPRGLFDPPGAYSAGNVKKGAFF